MPITGSAFEKWKAGKRVRLQQEFDHQIQQERFGSPQYVDKLLSPQQSTDYVANAGIPLLSDAAGLASDIKMFQDKPETRTIGNMLLSGVGLLPFVPAMTAWHGSPHKWNKVDLEKIGAGKGTRNFVNFNADDVKALSRNGEKIPNQMKQSNIGGFGMPDDFIASMNKSHPNVNAEISMNKQGVILLDKIKVEAGKRSGGIGGKFMDDLTKYADENGKTIALTAAGDYGGSKAGQKRFYKRHGFVDNSGKNKDFMFRENMLRKPKQ